MGKATSGRKRTELLHDMRESRIYVQLEMRSVERGICPIVKSTMTELFL